MARYVDENLTSVVEDTVGDEWLSYRHCRVPADAHPVQLTETERAFYAGAMATMTMIIEMGQAAGE